MTQPTFVPVADSAAVRPSAPTAVPQVGRAKKPGLLGRPGSPGGPGEGSPGPDAGYAMTLAEHLVHGLDLGPVAEHDVVVGVALLAAKRAALVGRAPCRSDVELALDLFGWRHEADGAVAADRVRRFSGLAHSYFAQRAFVDAVPTEALTQTPGQVRTLVYLATSRESQWRHRS